MKIKKSHIIGIAAGLIIIAVSLGFYFLAEERPTNLIYFLFGSGFLIMVLPFVIESVLETKIEREKDEMFLEFARALVESVESGTPISKSIINLKSKSFGSLSPHVEKLANQIELGIPIKDAFETFAYDTKSKTIIRAITLIREAEKTGGNISVILESVANSVSEIEKLKAERRSAIASIVVEGYIIFFIFIIIMIVMEIKILPMTGGIMSVSSGATDFLSGAGESVIGGGAGAGTGSTGTTAADFSFAFLSLLIAQGFFAGIVIGKLAEGRIKSGIKHSFIMVSMALLISTGAKLILGTGAAAAAA
jgi:flagellar protein FlaJ